MRSLPNGDLHLCDKELCVQALLNFGGSRSLKEEFECFAEVALGLLDGIALACNVEFGAQRNVAVAFAFDDCGELFLWHGYSNGNRDLAEGI